MLCVFLAMERPAIARMLVSARRCAGARGGAGILRALSDEFVPTEDQASCPLVSVVVPAHNEETVVGECLQALVRGTRARALDLVVVCNGCTDATADVAAAVGGAVHVLSIPKASKIAALNAGDERASHFPRFYVDADIIPGDGVIDALADALDSGPALIVAPAVRYDASASSWPVRSYLRIWSQLPSVKNDVVGRGMYALSRAARERFASFPEVLGDDHYIRDLVSPAERRVVESVSNTVVLPHSYSDLLRRKIRVHAGNRALDRADEVSRHRAARRRHEWLSVVRGQPRLVTDVPAYLGVALLSRLAGLARRAFGRSQVWDRAERPST